MLEIEIDGQKIEVADGSTVMDAANKVGAYIPHFCYHKKLSIAANCRMCLVDVEKAPKALPACATPVTPGMKVTTHSDKAVKAQKSVMEFLLINHPLDCPICDQGGECQLQDLAVGYGGSASRYKEEKRVVFNKNLGALINTDMTRCIHCTRCVRFGQEISGIMELGMAGRGEHSEIQAFVDRTVDSELSGNAIDLCPVGALTSKPFRFAARTWELARRRSVSPHDSLGANLIVQTKHDVVMRVLPFENEAVNECWLSDKDRFSYEGLTAADRLTQPRIKHGGEWHDVDWPTALDYVTKTLRGIVADHDASNVGALLSPHSTLEELYLAQKLVRGLGSDKLDFRLRQRDFSLDGKLAGAPWLGMKVADVSTLDATLVIGSFLRKDHPLLAQRLRQSVRHWGKLARVHVAREDWLIPVEAESIVAPSAMVDALAAVLSAQLKLKGAAAPESCAALLGSVSVTSEAEAIAEMLDGGEKRAVLLGNLAVQHPQYATLHLLAQEISRLAGASFGVIGEAANSVGGYLANALSLGSANTRSIIADKLRAYIVMGAEPELDCANGVAARAALDAAASVIYLGSFVGKAAEYADVMLPVAPFTETSGSFVNAEGLVQSFNAVAKPTGETRPGWKVLRVLGNMLGIEGFEQNSSEDVRNEVLALGEPAARLGNAVTGVVAAASKAQTGLQRVADVPIHFADPLARRATALQKTRDSALPVARFAASTLAGIGAEDGMPVAVRSTQGDVVLKARVDDTLPAGVVRIPAAHASTVALGDLFSELTVERA
ncbi:NADH-quinone oxidoreductase subunit NuoG [Viridibacterium curvum]|uniref:NADH-quinone oxidoreductase n=1 Tax=Viridibacterium curvum TaxID=1101404 RepID=A0ABP9Q918_9RHOO